MRWPLIVALVMWAVVAEAHVTSTGLAAVHVDGNALRYELTLNASEVDELFAPILEAAGKGDAGSLDLVTRAMHDYVRFSIAGEPCVSGRVGLRRSGGQVALETALACPKSTGTLWIRDDWPEVLGAHFQTVMMVNVAGSVAGQFAFLDERREATLELNAKGGWGWLSFIRMGAEHILSGPDHLLFLLALLALSRGVWPTVKIVTGFTVAHSITLSLAVLGLVYVPSQIVEPLIAASIVWVALENLLAPSGVGRRWLVAAVFGLVHGLGFASGLLDLGLARDALPRALVGFNVGVELGQIVFVAVALPPLAWASRPERWRRLPQALSLAVAVLGAMWLIERVFLSP